MINKDSFKVITTDYVRDFTVMPRRPIAEYQMGHDELHCGRGYVLALKLNNRFISTEQDLEYKTAMAKKEIAHYLYKDVISELYEISDWTNSSEAQKKIQSLIDRLVATDFEK